MLRLLKLLFDTDDSGGGKGFESDAIDLLEDFDTDDKDDKSGKDKDDLDDDKDDELDDKDDKDNDDTDDKEDEEEDSDSDSDDDKDDDKDDKEGKDDKDKEDKDKEDKKIEARDLTPQNLKEYDKQIFKAFPELKDVIYQNKEYNKIFGSVEEAQDAKENSETFQQMAETTLKGDPTDLLNALEKTGKGKIEEFSTNLLEYIRKEDKDAYYKVTDPVIAFALRGAEKYAADHGDKNLALAVKYMSSFVFNSKDIPSFDSGRRKEADPERVEFEKEKEKDRQEKYKEHETSIYEFTERKLTELIKTGLDPDNVYNDFVREALTDKIIGRIGQNLKKDAAFQGQMAALWKRASREGFSRESKQRIASTYLAKARRIMPAIRSQIRTEAAPKDDKGNKGNRDERRNIPSSGNRGGGKNTNNDPRKTDWKKSDEELLAE